MKKLNKLNNFILSILSIGLVTILTACSRGGDSNISQIICSKAGIKAVNKNSDHCYVKIDGKSENRNP